MTITLTKSVLGYVAVGALTATAALGVSYVVQHRATIQPVTPAQIQPRPLTPLETQFESIGQTYGPQLAAAYAQAYVSGAAALESGAAYSDAHAKTARAIADNRVALFDRALGQEFVKIIGEGTADKDVTSDQRANMTAAWRSLAAGLQKR